MAADPSALSRRQSRNENHQLPLHFAVRMNRPGMVALLLELGADPLAVDGWGMPAAVYAKTSAADRPVMEAIRAMTSGELLSAARGDRQTRGTMMDLVANVALGDWDSAARLTRENPQLLDQQSGVLHLMAKRGDVRAVNRLLDHGTDPNARWSHWDAEVTPLHLAVLGGHADIVRLLLEAGADLRVRDSKHDSDAIGWAEFFRRRDIVQILKAHAAKT